MPSEERRKKLFLSLSFIQASLGNGISNIFVLFSAGSNFPELWVARQQIAGDKIIWIEILFSPPLASEDPNCFLRRRKGKSFFRDQTRNSIPISRTKFVNGQYLFRPATNKTFFFCLPQNNSSFFEAGIGGYSCLVYIGGHRIHSRIVYVVADVSWARV